MAQLTVEQAQAIVAKAEERRLKKNAALKEWRIKNRPKYNEYIRQWRANKKAELEAAKALLGK